MLLPSVNSQAQELQDSLSGLARQISKLPDPYQQQLSISLEQLAQRIDALLSNVAETDTHSAAWSISGDPSINEARAISRQAFKTNLQMQSIFNNLIAVAILQDHNRVIQMANSSAIALFGFDPLRLSYETMYHRLEIRDEEGELLSSDDMPTMLARQGKVIQNMKVTVTNPRGRTYTALVSAMPMLTGDKISGVVSVWNDITRQERMIAERQQIEAQQAEDAIQMEVQRRLLDQRERERQEIARNIHDGPIQNMVSNLFNLQMTKETLRDQEAISVLNHVVLNIKSTIQELRDVVNELRPPVILHFGLSRTIQIHTQDIHAKFPDLTVYLDLMNDEKMISDKVCLALYRIYQESLNNIIRHAHATKAWIRYALVDNEVLLEIKDNGQGFIIPADWSDLTQQNHFGVPGMRERVAALGGKMFLTSQPGQGTVVKVVVPRDT